MEKSHYSLINDLTELKINTIIDREISGTSTPSPSTALEQIRSAYERVLGSIEKQIVLENSGKPEGQGKLKEQENLDEPGNLGKPEKLEKSEGLSNKKATFTVLKNSADNIIDKSKNGVLELSSRQLSMARRVQRFAPQLAVLEAKATLSTDEQAFIRRCWELGDSQVAAQTIIQASGDVITRVNPDVITSDNKRFYDFHLSSTQTSLQYWSMMIDTLTKLFTGVFKKFFSLSKNE